MTVQVSLEEIKEALRGIDPIPLIEEGFCAYSRGEVVVPPIGEMIFEDPPGDVHIKYGYIKGDDYYVIKIASGFIRSERPGSYLSNGMMLLFKQGTGGADGHPSRRRPPYQRPDSGCRGRRR